MAKQQSDKTSQQSESAESAETGGPEEQAPQAPAEKGGERLKVEEHSRRAAAPEDSGLSTLERWMQHRNLIAGGLVVIVLAIAGIYFYGDYREEQEKEATGKALQSLAYFRQDSMAKSVESTLGRPGLQAIAEDYGGTKTGNLAAYLAGVAYLQMGQPEQALGLLDDYDPGEDVISAAALAARAAAYEETGGFEQAAKTYEQAAQTAANSQTTPLFLNEAARCWEEAGELATARGIYTRIQREFPGSPEAEGVRKDLVRLRLLTGAEAG